MHAANRCQSLPEFILLISDLFMFVPVNLLLFIYSCAQLAMSFVGAIYFSTWYAVYLEKNNNKKTFGNVM